MPFCCIFPNEAVGDAPICKDLEMPFSVTRSPIATSRLKTSTFELTFRGDRVESRRGGQAAEHFA
jgi:hypothetical protein